MKTFIQKKSPLSRENPQLNPFYYHLKKMINTETGSNKLR